MKFFKRPYLLRRYRKPEIVQGYISIPYQDQKLLMDVQTLKAEVLTTEDGSKTIQQLKVFCDDEILVENEVQQQRADRLWFQKKWFECRSSRLSENTPLRHWTAIFIECLNQEEEPEKEFHTEKEGRAGKDEFSGSERKTL